MEKVREAWVEAHLISQPWGQRINGVEQSKRGGVFVCDMERQRETVGEVSDLGGGGGWRECVGQGHRLAWKAVGEGAGMR
jgi:hypothetical protein